MSPTRNPVLLAVLIPAVLHVASAFYLPGLAPVNYCKPGSTTKQCQTKIDLFVNRLDSDESVIPYEYQHFDFCTTNGTTSPAENLGQVVFGERIRLSPYQRLDQLRKGMMKQYRHHWIVDNMPVTWCYLIDTDKQYCSMGFPMGCFTYRNSQPRGLCSVTSEFSKPETFYLFNHVDLTISYHKSEKESWGSSFIEEGGRIISVKVQPRSINHKNHERPTCDTGEHLTLGLKDDGPLTITYTYSVTFVVSRD
ncbi:hypothetical protein HPB51_024754 [Rhipicephalus microplus]|uniref:Transmembrane 9 superfamily member n=1 Tax=Rhipicephalus microplus TaxID=6941 RepID=A0A9J6D8G4_RHIMP|nr:hypothetical protein HPB51_024754 [Rhipicephalus microplus]